MFSHRSYVTNALDYNYRLRSVIGQEDNFTVNKWKCFDTQVRDTYLWSWMIPQSLVDYTDMGRIICCILDNVYVPSMSMKYSIGSLTTYFHTSMVVHSWTNNHLQIHNLIHGNILFSSSKKQQNGKVSLNNGILGVDCKMTINMLMKHLIIAVRYFYIIDLLIYERISKVIYNPIKTMKSDYLTKTIQGTLICINKLKSTKVNGIKSIRSK